MGDITEILSLAYKEKTQPAALEAIHTTEWQIPGSMHYSVKRFSRTVDIVVEDTGIINYAFTRSRSKENFLELRFCVAGNVYCDKRDCNNCNLGKAIDCGDSEPSIDIVTVKFTAPQLSVYSRSSKAYTEQDSLLQFTRRSSFKKIIPVCCKLKSVLNGLVNHPYSGSIENIYINAQLQMLLLYSMDCMVGEKDIETINCKFLTNEADKEKIQKARELLIQHIGEPITIKDLSRKVAMNECYLKKGFKETYGRTIFDFYQSQRMEHAKYLLYEKGLSVTDVSMLLGYSSISHFSTAFKKHTGLKPCELLFR